MEVSPRKWAMASIASCSIPRGCRTIVVILKVII
jgi:hypothetical protein